MNNSCSIFFYEGYVGVAPTIINLTKSLISSGYTVTIYGTENPFPNPGTIDIESTIIYFQKAYNTPLLSKIFLFINYKLKWESISLVIELIVFIVNILKNTESRKKSQNDIGIGVDTNGSIAALINYYLFKKKFFYLSLELNHPKSFNGFAKIINLFERLAYRKSEGVIIQDEDRFKTLCEYNHYQHPRVFYLPNSASSSDPLVKDTESKNYFREMFNLSEDEFPYLILQAGIIHDAVYSKELANAFAGINNGSALIFHEREKRELNEPYIKSLREVNLKNLFLSLEPLPFEQIDKIYISATIGLAFYRDIDKNYSQISMASGKISYYLKHGKPIIANNLKSLSTLIEKYQIGVVVQEPSNSLEINIAIEDILSNYSFYSKNARACFEEEFDFEKKTKPILSFISSW